MASSSDGAVVVKEDESEQSSEDASRPPHAVAFDVDHRLIPQAQIEDASTNALVQEVYDQSVFESNVLAQVEKAAERERQDKIAAKQRQIADIEMQLKTATGERFNELAQKKHLLAESLAASNSVDAVSTVLLDLRNEDVRLGKATPFGTTVVQESDAPSAFDDFLSGIGTKRQKKIAQKQKAIAQRKQRMEKSETEPEADEAPSTSSKMSLHSDMPGVDRLLKYKHSVDDDDDLDREYESEDDEEVHRRHGKGSPSRRHRASPKHAPFIDDADVVVYSRRLRRWEKEDASKRDHHLDRNGDEDTPKNEILVFDDGLKAPARLWRQLYSYQRTAVRWLYELHVQGHGGILADEMGLGKTIEMCAFLFALRLSKRPDIGAIAPNIRKYVGLGPVLIVCPATLLRQWAAELHVWAPVFRAVVLHNTTGTTSQPLNDLLLEVISNAQQAPPIVITTYATLLMMSELMLAVDWHYVILDEGHKVRNPDAKVTVVCKQFVTSHRIVVTGSPMQNNLKELWCLMDFVYPGKLGSIRDFMGHLAVPIVQGGYANATPVQLQTAYKCAVVLRDTINPYILRRTKNDVKASLALPSKTEQVLFCKLTDHQEHIYVSYLNLTTIKRTISGDSEPQTTVLPSALKRGATTRHRLPNQGQGSLFAILIRLRHICNHPDLVRTGSKNADPQTAARHWQHSAKMVVVESLLKTWKAQDHRVLLFSQTKTMLDILEEFIRGLGYVYARMDGDTPINQRQNLINDFNQGRSRIFVFLLTTRVGGLGVNLTGADRVIIYDPDWNPTTDTQARERAWRIGQTKDVVIYRLLTSGTIEEKVYHRQIFKQFLTNRVLKDPKQRRFFKVNDIHELFTYTGGRGIKDGGGRLEKANSGSSLDFSEKTPKPPKLKAQKSWSTGSSPTGEDAAKKRAMDLAKRLSRKLEMAGSSKTDQPSTSRVEEPARKKIKGESVVVDGAKVPNAVRLEVAKVSGGHSEKRHKKATDGDRDVLKKLLKCGGVAETLDFEALVASRPDQALIDAEADRVAEAAVQALRQSQRGHVQPFGAASSGQLPRFGTVVKQPEAVVASTVPQEPPNSFGNKAGASGGDDLVEVLRKRAAEASLPSTSMLEDENYYSEDEEDESDRRPASGFHVAVSDDTESLLTDLRAFISFQATNPGQASSEEIIKHFGKEKDRFGADSFRVFRYLLRRICFFARRPSDGAGLWTLKPRFR